MRSLGGIFFAGVILLSGLLSAAPGWHEQLHPDAGAAAHLCIVTLFTGGQYEAHVNAPACVAPDRPEPLQTLIVRETPARPKAHLFARLEHAPPAFA